MTWMTFDLDGVLMENPFGSGVFPHILERLVLHRQGAEDGGEKDAEGLRRETYGQLLAFHKKRFGTHTAYEAYDWDAIVRELTEYYGYPGTFDVAELVKLYCHAPHIQVHDGADSVLAALKRQGWKVGVVTNGYARYQVPVLEALGLYPLIDRIVTPDEAHGIKPDSVMFHAIPHVREADWVHVGDTLAHDVFGGRRAGAQTAWVYRRMPEELKALPAWERPSTSMGREAVRTVWEKEASRYQGFCTHWEECIPDGIIYDLAELLQWRKELLTDEKTS